MGIDEKARERSILDVTAQLLLRHGYNKVTMSDVADAVGLNRRLVYLLFPSKDALIKALLLREVNLYAEAWKRYLERDPLGGHGRQCLSGSARYPQAVPIDDGDVHARLRDVRQLS